MLRVILLFSLLYLANASPIRLLSLHSDEKPHRYTLREEKFEFGNSDLGGGEQNSPYYESEIGDSSEYEYYPYDGYVYGEYYIDSDDIVSSSELDELIDSLEMCEENEDGPINTDEGCIYFDEEGNIHLWFGEYDIEDTEKVVDKAGLVKCEMDGYGPVIPIGGCVYTSEDGGIHVMGLYKNDEVEKPELLTDVIGDVQPCVINEGEVIVPPQGCVWFDDERNIHLLNVIDDGNRGDALRVLQSSELFRECVLGEAGPIVPEGGCVFLEGSSIHILGMQEYYVTHDDDDVVVDYQDYGDYYDSDEEDVMLYSIKKVIGSTTGGKHNLQKALRPYDFAKNVNAVTLNNIILGQKPHKTPRKAREGKRNTTNTQRTSQNVHNVKSGPRYRPREKRAKSSYKKGN